VERVVLLLPLLWRLLLPPLVLVRVLSVTATLLWVVEKEAEVVEEWGWWLFRLWFARWER
jgi:hypothetical protein